MCGGVLCVCAIVCVYLYVFDIPEFVVCPVFVCLCVCGLLLECI
jgi:hypothetical protein